MKLGTVHVAHPITLASLEEHSNYPFRLLMKQHGASLVCGERVDATDVARRDRRAMRLLYTTPAEAPRAAQLSGSDPAVMAAAARVVAEVGFDLVDLNFECPVRRLLARGEGGALMADPQAIGRIVEAVVRAVGQVANLQAGVGHFSNVPGTAVTIKIRSGPDADHETAVDVAERAEAAGAAGVCIHARSVAQGYVGGPDWGVISRVKQAIPIPVIGSGGIREAADVVRMLRETGTDAVAIGRGCLGNPWIFRQARALLSGGAAVRPPTPVERGRALLQLVEGEFHLYGAPLALRRLPRVSGYFAQFLPDEAPFRESLREVRNLGQYRRLVKEHFG
jgi:tRNA-dihydrouridine synthase B